MEKNSYINSSIANTPVYWYPGSNADLVPLLLFKNNSGMGHKLILPSSKQTKLEDKSSFPLLLWLNDGCPEMRHIDQLKQKFQSAQDCYPNLWNMLGATIQITSIVPVNVEILTNSTMKTYLIGAEVTRSSQGVGEITDKFEFLYTHGDALDLVQIFWKARIEIKWVALLKFAAMSGTIERLPSAFSRLLRTAKQKGLQDYNSFSHPSIPEMFISDRDWLGNPTYPEGRNLAVFERLGSRDPAWGDNPQELRPEDRVRGGGIRHWGYNTASLWVRNDLYDTYLTRLPT